MTDQKEDRSQQTYEEAIKARPPKTRGKEVRRFKFPQELVLQVIENLERDHPGTVESIKEIMRDGFEHWDELEEQATTNRRHLSNTCKSFRAIVEHDDPYWASSDLMWQVYDIIESEIDSEK